DPTRGEPHRRKLMLVNELLRCGFSFLGGFLISAWLSMPIRNYDNALLRGPRVRHGLAPATAPLVADPALTPARTAPAGSSGSKTRSGRESQLSPLALRRVSLKAQQARL